MSFIAWLIIGGLAGWLASMFMNKTQGIFMNIIVGIVGAYIGGFLGSAIGIRRADLSARSSSLRSGR